MNDDAKTGAVNTGKAGVADPLGLLPDNRMTDGDMANFDRAFGLVAFTMNRYIADHLLRFARQFGPDYQMMVVWTVLAHQSVLHLAPLDSRPNDLLNEKGLLAEAMHELRPVRQRDLSQITGIPKETVRRKLLKLERNGWIIRQGSGWVMALERIDPELREFSRESARRFLAAAEHMRTLMRSVESDAR